MLYHGRRIHHTICRAIPSASLKKYEADNAARWARRQRIVPLLRRAVIKCKVKKRAIGPNKQTEQDQKKKKEAQQAVETAGAQFGHGKSSRAACRQV